ncbi:MAG TPA: hypothetical protein VGM33_19405 [Baekduia sp.]
MVNASDSGHWGTLYRNTIGSPAITLDAAPGLPPYGTGSLGFLVGSDEKAAYGNEIDFAGDALSDITQLGYSLYATGEDLALSTTTAANAPGVSVEVDPTGTADGTAPNYATLVYLPPVTVLPNAWTTLDTTQDARWYYTGAAGTQSGCDQITYCTFEQAKNAFPDATVLSVSVTKGRDFAFQGAVDGVQVNDTIYDFERLTGPQGTPGTDGTNGADGTNGVDGTNGTDGVDGTHGTNGLAGTNGTNGLQGIAGPVGPAGPAGPAAVSAASSTPTVCHGASVRTLTVPTVKGYKLVSAKATLRGKALKVSGRKVTVNLAGRSAGSYNISITAKYTKAGKTRTVKTTRGLSVACS